MAIGCSHGNRANKDALPPHIVELMMVAFKVQRSARVFHPDNYVDLRAYAAFAEHAQEHPGEPYDHQK